MQLKSMKVSKQEREEHHTIKAVNPDVPEYPYGLKIHLDKEALSKLGIEKLPEVGSEMKLMAVVKVCDVSQHKSIYGEDRSLGLQITDMAVGGAKEQE